MHAQTPVYCMASCAIICFMPRTANVGGAVDESRTHWPRWFPLLIIVVVLIAVIAAGAWLSGLRLNMQTADVPVPASNASPETVVRTYVKAYNHRDFDTMAALYPGERSLYKAERYRVMGTMSDFKITGSHHDTTHGRHSSYWDIDVEFNYTGLRDSDNPYPPGPNAWTYVLDRSGPDHAWRIFDHGVG